MEFHRTFAEWSQWMWPHIANHLWQTTPFVLLAWIAALLLRRSATRVRYIVWMIALVKFLLPSALLILIFEWAGLDLPRASRAIHTGAGIVSQIAQPAFPVITDYGAVFPAEPAATTSPASGEKHREDYCLLSLFWGLGALVFLSRWSIRRRRFRLLLRTGAEITAGREVAAFNRIKSWLSLNHKIRLVATPELQDLGVWRIWRPVIVLPEGLAERLNDRELESVMMHELVHVMRYDNLISTCQMLICCLFWFHPFVWLIDRQLSAEREVMCDEAVIRYGGDPQIYATSLWKVAQYGFGWSFAGISRAARSSLSKRIKLMLDTQDRTKPSVLSRALAGTSICGLIAFAIGMAVFIRLDVNAANSQAPVLPRRQPPGISRVPAENVPAAAPAPADTELHDQSVDASTPGRQMEVTQDQQPSGQVPVQFENDLTTDPTSAQNGAYAIPLQFENDPQSPVSIWTAFVTVSEPFDSQATCDSCPRKMQRDIEFHVTVGNRGAGAITNLSLSVESPLFSRSGIVPRRTNGSLGANRMTRIFWRYIVDDREDFLALVPGMRVRVTGFLSESDTPSDSPLVDPFGSEEPRDGMILVHISFMSQKHMVFVNAWNMELANRAFVKSPYPKNRLSLSGPPPQYEYLTITIKPLNETGEVLKPKIVYQERPIYTAEARANGVQGRVLLDVVFGRDGTLIIQGASHGLPDGLTDAAIRAAQKIRFQPAEKDGEPVSVSGRLRFVFALDQ